MASLWRTFWLLVLAAALPGWGLAAPAPFDLAGPELQVQVTRLGKTLPIAQVPNLAEGDRLSIRADLPKTQSVHYLLVSVFLRGATNPPPDAWFAQSETWTRKGAAGLNVVVPPGAQQVLVFLAPETGGDFKTLVNAVRSRPGAFVRASQDLNQATLDRSRLNAFIAAVHAANQADPDSLKAISPLLSRSLTIKLDPGCLQKAAEFQAPCLVQGQDSLVLDDGHSTSIVEALTSGYSGDLVQALSATPQAGGGYYSPYVASVLDIAHILDSFHTAQYQYIPALGTQQDATLSLLLNAPPSFQNPKSVLVVALPAVEAPQPPPLHPIDPNAAACAEKPGLVLPAQGAPLVFSTDYAHSLVLRLKDKTGRTVDLPTRADAEKGGLVVDTAGLQPDGFDDVVTGTLQGYWGFEPYAGPTFQLLNARPQGWRVAAQDQQALIAGREDALRLEGHGAACVQAVMLQQASGAPEMLAWKIAGADAVTVSLPLNGVRPGPATLLVKSYGGKTDETVPLQVYGAASRLDAFTIHAGDRSGQLTGAGLEQVTELDVDGIAFRPDPSAATDTGDGLALVATDVQAIGKLKAGRGARAKVALKDGRTLGVQMSVLPPRPNVVLIGKSIQRSAPDPGAQVQLSDGDELPRRSRLTFSVRAQPPMTLTGAERIEVATADGAFMTTLTAANGGLVLEDSHVALATLDTGKAFNDSAFGALRFRMVSEGGAGDWQPLATLVRVPALSSLDCPAATDQPCRLAGGDLFLIDSLSNDPGFGHPVQVVDGFPGASLEVPRPTDGKLYLKLRDDPGPVNFVAFPASAPTDVAASGAPAPADPATGR
jgi:hypothetical protein